MKSDVFRRITVFSPFMLALACGSASALAQATPAAGAGHAVVAIDPGQARTDVNQRRSPQVPRPEAVGQDPAFQQPVQEPPASAAEPLPLDSLAQVNNDYKITANDLIEFDVFGIPDMRRDVRVNASGMVTLPLIGSVMVAGMTGQQAEDAIAARYGERYLQNPQVSIFIKEFTTQRITVEGAVNKPGIYPVVGKVTLLRALALAGGQAKFADLEQVMLYRYGTDGDRRVATFDLEKVRAGEVQDPEILADDVIVVRRDPSRTALRDSLFSDVLDTINPFSR
ncbi:polysaccharide biosynthesis/export family protein [Hydrogenophaga sp. 5NK40-0174]|uniref:polysaccharide biosynthesis/export family protein n=1 Tax=Hydrogenophaga sp. 5NK40-0174 TaxID=3127649 RepID=UPI003103776F